MAHKKITKDQIQHFVFNGKEYKMTTMERLFALAYCQNGGNASGAAVTAGYSERTKVEIGWEVLRRPHVMNFIKAIQDDIAAMLGISAVDIAREYARIGFSNFRNVFDKETGQILEPKDFDDATAASVAYFEVTEVYEPKTGRFIGKNKKLKFHDKLVALDKLARMIGCDAKAVNVEAKVPPPLQIEIKSTTVKIKKDGDN